MPYAAARSLSSPFSILYSSRVLRLGSLARSALPAGRDTCSMQERGGENKCTQTPTLCQYLQPLHPPVLSAYETWCRSSCAGSVCCRWRSTASRAGRLGVMLESYSIDFRLLGQSLLPQ